MALENHLYDYACKSLPNEILAPVKGLDIWTINDQQTVFSRDESIKEGELQSWLEEIRAFRRPTGLEGRDVKGRLRLIYQAWDRDVAGTPSMPMTRSDLDLITGSLDLPRCFIYDFASRKHVPLRIKEDLTAKTLGMICQSAALEDSFMVFALKYTQSTNTTTGYLGFQVGPEKKGPGSRLIRAIKDEAIYADTPLLVPVLTFRVWTDYLHRQYFHLANRLRNFQKETGLLEPYLQSERDLQKTRTALMEKPMKFDAVHSDLVSLHAHLKNGMSDFVSILASSTIGAFVAMEKFRPESQGTNNLSAETELKSYVEHMQLRANTELQHRQRMLDRIGMYLQVLYSLMQQQVARETKRDSSAMKSISLLTMVFLPATAIATAMSPFIILNTDGSQMSMSSQFWIFWAIAGPTTFLVVITWALWIERVEMM